MRRAVVALAALLCSGGAVAAVPDVAIGSFASEQSCTTYLLAWGRESARSASLAAGYVNGAGAGFVGASASSMRREWGTRLVQDCVSQFAHLRQTMRAALASGPIRVGPGGYVLTGRLSLADGGTMSITRPDMADTRSDVSVQVRYSLNDRAGRAVFGGVLTKRVGTSSSLETADGRFDESGGDGFATLQNAVGLAVARAVSFHLSPLRVVDGDGRRVRLNYGAPFLSLGDTVQLPTRRGLATIKALVISAANGSAIVEADGGGDLGDVPVGGVATFIEADDPAANGRRFDRVDLP